MEHAGGWVAANALAWLAGLPVVFALLAMAPAEPVVLRAAFAVAGGVGMGATVAAVTGLFLVRLLRHPRRRPLQPLRHRTAIRLNRIHGWACERSGGRLGGPGVLLLTTTGRRTGRLRRTPVQYQSDDGELVVVAAARGAPHAPAWWHNLEADPRVTVRLGSSERGAVAETAGERERRALWPRLCARNHWLEPAQARAGREFPVVRLRFADDGGRSPDDD